MRTSSLWGSPVHFTLYANDCSSNFPSNWIFKFRSADYTVILNLLQQDTGLSSYFTEVKTFVHWCDANHLLINVNTGDGV